MSGPDTEFEDYEDPLSSIRSGGNYLASLVLRLTLHWPTVACAVHSLQLMLMKPETFAFITLIGLVFLVSHTFEFWIQVCSKIPCKWNFRGLPGMASVVASANKIGGGQLRPGDFLELNEKNVGGFGLRGRRATMEDRLDYVDESLELGMQFYGVFDGHGGDAAAEYVNKKLFKAIVSRVRSLKTKAGNIENENCKIPIELVSLSSASCQETKSSSLFRRQSSRDTETCFVTSSGSSDHQSSHISSEQLSKILTEEVLALDDQLMDELKKSANFAGTTAIFAVRVLSDNKLLVANIGDSRGVLCNSRGIAVPMSVDHKPQSFKEHKRIKEAGGFIKFTGVWRVAGVLATSRAIGDYPLKEKKFIIADPTIEVFDLNERPQFAILASDGLFDTMSNEEVVNFVRDSLANLRKRQTKKEHLAFEAARALANESYRRLSLDNVTVVIILFDPSEFSGRSGYTPSTGCSLRKSSAVQGQTSRAIS